MNLHVRPILSALLRNRTGAILVSLQIAIALAVLVNAVYIVKQRVDKIGRPTGMDVENIFTIASEGFTEDFDLESTIREDVAWLRSLDGVVAVTPINAVPLSGGGSSTGLSVEPGDTVNAKPANYFEIDHQGLEALGVRLVAGRAFHEHEILPPRSLEKASDFAPQIIVTKALARELFPDGDALGKVVYDMNRTPATIVGIVEHMHGSWVSWDKVDHVFFAPRLAFPFGPRSNYLVRTKPGRLHETMRLAEEYLSTSNPNRVIAAVRPLETYSKRSYLGDRNMGIFLVAVTTLLLAITALGIFGLATFNVSTRTKQIGTRRAVGARRADIVRYFLVENWLITTTGVVVGCALALGAGYWLSVEYELPRLDLYYLVGGVLVLWILGQLAAWQPARRAASIPPAVATRTV